MSTSQLESLRHRLGKLLDQDEVRTYGYIEKNFKISKSTLCRILSGETKNPRLPTFKKLEEAVYTLECETSESIRKDVVDQELRSFWKETRENDYAQEYRTLTPYQLQVITATESIYETFLLISNCGEKPYRRDEVLTLIGDKAQKNISILIDKDIIFEDQDGGLITRFPKWSVDSPESMLRMNGYENNFFRLGNLGESAAIVRNTNSTSAEGVKEYRKAIYDFCRKISEIERTHPGDIPFHVNCIGNILDENRYYESLNIEKEPKK